METLPEDALPTDVIDTEDGWRISNHQPVQTKQKNTVRTETFIDYLLSHEEHVTHYYTRIDFLTVSIKIYELIKSTNKVNIATDGGAIPFKGSLGFVFADDNETY